MSFVQRLTKISRKASQGNQIELALNNQITKINIKNTRKLTQFQKHHSDLKSMLEQLSGQQSTTQRLFSTPMKNKTQNNSKDIRHRSKNNSIDTKQNAVNDADAKLLFKNNPETRMKLKIKGIQDNLQLNQVDKHKQQSFLIKNLKYNKKSSSQSDQNPEASTKPCLTMKKSLVLSNKSSIREKKGIPNIGNTCYINTVLQCLFHLKDFNEGFVVNFTDKNQILKKYINLYENVMKKNQQNLDLSTLPLKRSVSKICSLFIDFHQQDAHQFLKQLLQSIHQQINRIKSPGVYKMLESSTNKKNLSVLSDQYWNYYKKFDDSYIYDSLCGQICSYVQCANCKFQSVNFDNFLDLSLPMIKGKNKLQDLIKQYFDVEALGDFYYCSSCKKYSKKSLKRSQLWKNPNYLIVQLKRSQFGKKNNQNIRIPVRCLNMKPFFTTVQKQPRSTMYHLQGVVLHKGIIQGGHYWAHAKDGLSWYSIDDQNVQVLDKDEIIKKYEQQGSSEAYILFYKCM